MNCEGEDSFIGFILPSTKGFTSLHSFIRHYIFKVLWQGHHKVEIENVCGKLAAAAIQTPCRNYSHECTGRYAEKLEPLNKQREKRLERFSEK